MHQKGVMSDYSLVKVSMCSHFWSPLLCTFIREQDCCEPRFISRDVCEQIILAIATSYASENNCMCMGPTTINTNYPPSPCFKPHIHTIMVTVYWLTLIIFAITLFAVYSASILILPIRKHVILQQQICDAMQTLHSCIQWVFFKQATFSCTLHAENYMYSVAG